LEEAKKRRNKIEQRIEDSRKTLVDTEALLSLVDLGSLSAPFAEIDALRDQVCAERPLTIETCGMRKQEVREIVQGRVDANEKKLRTIGERIVNRMQSFHHAYPIDAQEMDATVEAASEYEAMLHTVFRPMICLDLNRPSNGY